VLVLCDDHTEDHDDTHATRVGDIAEQLSSMNVTRSLAAAAEHSVTPSTYDMVARTLLAAADTHDCCRWVKPYI
jgi:hypothetical protein